MRDYRDEIKITRNGEERPFNETLLDDISRQPENYKLTRLNWSPQMATYIRSLAGIFGCRSDASRSDVAEAIRLWYVELPQITRNSRYDHTAGEQVPVSVTRTAFFNAVRRIETDSNVLLFEELPSIFGAKVGPTKLGTNRLVSAIRREKKECDSYLNDTVDRLAAQLMELFAPDFHGDATLGSILHDWVDEHPEATTHVFSGLNNQVLSAVRAANGNDRITVGRIAKAATTLRIDDWNDARFTDFMRIVSDMKTEVEGAATDSDGESASKRVGIVLIDRDGETKQRTFNVVECSGRSRLLKNSILACLNEMGSALSPEEKRQIVFEVLEGLC